MKIPDGDCRIVLTADRTLMSDYHHNEFLGFGACAPPNVLPNWFYKWLFFPPIKTEGGVPVAAPYGLRKIEGELALEGFDAVVVDPDHLGKYLENAKVLSVYVMDPFGLGPASSTFAFFLQKEPFLAEYFRKLMSSKEIKEAKERGLKVILGGPGVWQFKYRPEFARKYGIDCIIEGEGEKVIGKIVRAALNDENLPEYYEVPPEEVPSLEEIPEIIAPSINELVEIGRGCCRGCRFCNVTLRPLRWYPYEKILKEIEVNRKTGNGVCLHAEDVMLYGSRNTTPDAKKLTRLHEIVSDKCDRIGWSHCSLAAVASSPKLFSQVAEIILQKQSWWGAEVGIETGSAELAKKIMPAKAHPFKVEEWPEVIRTGMGLMHDNMLVPACTLIVGGPEETEDDLIKTIEMMDDLRDIRSLIVPLFFVPMGRFRDEEWFDETEMNSLHQELLLMCLRHDLYWADSLIDLSIGRDWPGKLRSSFYKLFLELVKRRIEREGVEI